METNKQKPAHTIKVGRVKAAIWSNKTEKGGTRHNVTVTRLYKDGDTWKDSQSFGRDEIPLVIKALDQAHTWIFGNSKSE